MKPFLLPSQAWDAATDSAQRRNINNLGILRHMAEMQAQAEERPLRMEALRAQAADREGQARYRDAQIGDMQRKAAIAERQDLARGVLSNLLSTGGYAGVEGQGAPPAQSVAMTDAAAIEQLRQAGDRPMSVNVPNPGNVAGLSVMADPAHAIPTVLKNSMPQQSRSYAPHTIATDQGYFGVGTGNTLTPLRHPESGLPLLPPRAAGGGRTGGVSAAPDAGDFTKTGEDFLASLSPEDRVLVKKVANYEVDPKTLSVVGGHRERALKLAAQYDPSFDQKNYASQAAAINRFNTGQQGNTVRSLNVAIEHMDTARKLGEALKNSDVPAFNALANEFAKQTGQAAPTSFNAVREIVASEVVKGVIGGAGALEDRKEAANKIRAASSPEQLIGVFDSWAELLGGQLKGLEQQYRGATGRKDFNEKFLTPRALAAMQGPGGAPKSGPESWIERAMNANPGMTIADVLKEGRQRGKIPQDYQYGGK